MYLERKDTNRLYCIWVQMRSRCRSPRQESYKRRKIWWAFEFDDYMGFREWALCNGYTDDLSLDRIDNNAGYSQDNCKWSTKTEQQYNQHKKVEANLTSKFRGVSLDKRRNKFRARIYIDKKEKLLGYFNNENDAANAYNMAIVANNINAPLNVI